MTLTDPFRFSPFYVIFLGGGWGVGGGDNFYFCVFILMETFTLKLILTMENPMPRWVYISSFYVSVFVILERKKEPKEMSSCLIPHRLVGFAWQLEILGKALA